MTQDAAELLDVARDRIAAAVLPRPTSDANRLGPITLRPHQIVAIARLREIIGLHRGALLADGVGLGKTFVALTIAREHRRPLIVCPAGLRPMWERAMATISLDFPIETIERLARGVRPKFTSDMVIVDEAHHLRNPATRRYQAIADLARRARVLLLSATPLQNSRRDLTALLALFVGSAAHEWPDETLARLIVRRDEAIVNEPLPAIVGPHSLSPGFDDDCLSAICSLPLAVPAADEGVAAALTTISLVHLWASSRAALTASLRKRRARAIALGEAVANGHLPTAAELSAWHFADETLQLAFPFCVADSGPVVEPDAIADRLIQYISAVTAAIDLCAEWPNPDTERVALLRMIRATHPGARVVAFSQYAHTVTALAGLMRGDHGVAVVTADQARIASGPVSRAEVLAQFAGGAPPSAAVDRIGLVLSTDLLSEGVDLRGASVIVHLDLPWNPARLEQRVGRARRLGSPHDRIHVYTFAPPAAAERMLELRRRLNGKMSIAASVLGETGVLAFGPTPAIAPVESPVGAAETLRARLAAWLNPSISGGGHSPVVAAAVSSRHGWIAAVRIGGSPRLICDIGDGLVDDTAAFSAAIDDIAGPCAADDERLRHVVADVERWIASQCLAIDVGVTSGSRLAHRAVLDRLASTVAHAPRHRRSRMIAAAQRARRGVLAATGIGAERVLGELARSPADDDAWIQSVEAFGSLQDSNPATPSPSASGIIAIILFTRDDALGSEIATGRRRP